MCKFCGVWPFLRLTWNSEQEGEQRAGAMCRFLLEYSWLQNALACFWDQPAARPCHLPGRHRLPQLLLLGFISQTEPEEPGTWAKNNPLEGCQAALRALELVLVSGRALGWAVAAGHAGTSPAGAWEGGRGKEGGKALCLRLAPIFTPRSKQLEVFPGPVAPASPKSGFQPAASAWLLLSRNVSHLLCTFQLGPLYPAVGMCWFQQHSWHQSSFLRTGSETFPKPFKGFGCFETPSFQQ